MVHLRCLNVLCFNNIRHRRKGNVKQNIKRNKKMRIVSNDAIELIRHAILTGNTYSALIHIHRFSIQPRQIYAIYTFINSAYLIHDKNFIFNTLFTFFLALYFSGGNLRNCRVDQKSFVYNNRSYMSLKVNLSIIFL